MKNEADERMADRPAGSRRAGATYVRARRILSGKLQTKSGGGSAARPQCQHNVNLTLLQLIKYSLKSIGFCLEETGMRVIKLLLEQILLLASNLISLLHPLIFVGNDRIQPI